MSSIHSWDLFNQQGQGVSWSYPGNKNDKSRHYFPLKGVFEVTNNEEMIKRKWIFLHVVLRDPDIQSQVWLTSTEPHCVWKSLCTHAKQHYTKTQQGALIASFSCSYVSRETLVCQYCKVQTDCCPHWGGIWSVRCGYRGIMIKRSSWGRAPPIQACLPLLNRGVEGRGRLSQWPSEHTLHRWPRTSWNLRK